MLEVVAQQHETHLIVYTYNFVYYMCPYIFLNRIYLINHQIILYIYYMYVRNNDNSFVKERRLNLEVFRKFM